MMSNRSRRFIVAVVAALAVISVGVASYIWWPREPASAPTARWDAGDPADDFDTIAVTNPGYLGVQACAECHAERVAEFQKTRHAIACCEPTVDVMHAGFKAGLNRHVPANSDIRFEMERDKEGCHLVVIRPKAGGEERTRSRIGLSYGFAGAADEMYFTWHGNELYELPVAWLYPLNKWGNISLPRESQGDLGRATTPRCLECHNTWMEHVPGTANEYRRDNIILGTTCERCHGPGKEHVAHHKTNADSRPGQAIVRPARLERESRLAVCTQCHSNTPKRRGPAFTFRPGKPLDSFFRFNSSKNPEDDHVANQIKYLRMSKCFEKSDMTCTTCHNPHRPTDHAETARSCMKCHQSKDCKDQPKLPAEIRNDCSACHMPPRVWMNVHFHTEKDLFVPPIRRFDHRIAVHPETRKELVMEWHRKQAGDEHKQLADKMTKELVDYWLAEADRRRKDFRFLAAIGAAREALRIDVESIRAKQVLAEMIRTQTDIHDQLGQALLAVSQQRLPEAVQQLERILSVKPDHATAHVKLGGIYAAQNNSAKAAHHYEEVGRSDPNDASGLVGLGLLALNGGRPELALNWFRKADEIESYSEAIKYHLGVTLLQLKRPKEAEVEFRQALTINPKHAGAAQGLSHLLRQKGEVAEALRLARRAARLTEGKHPDVMLTLAEAFADSGQIAEAIDAAEKGSEAAKVNNPILASQLRKRLEEWRTKR